LLFFRLPQALASVVAMRPKIILLGAEPASLVNFRLPLVKQLVANGYDVHAAAAMATPDHLRILNEAGATFHPIAFARAGMNPAKDLKTFWQLFKLFKREKPDAVITYTPKPNIYGILAATFAGVPHRVAMVTGLGYTFIEGPELKRHIARRLAHFLYRLSLKRCSTIIFQNPDDRDEMARRGLFPASMITHIVNGSGVDTNSFAPAPLPEQPIFLLIARILVDKGIREFAMAAQRVKQQNRLARFQILGALDPSPNAIGTEELKSWEAVGVEYLGEVKDVRPSIAAASVIVLPSYREGTPRSVLEGMSMGRAIVTTDVPGCRETVVDGLNGFLVPARDVMALTAAMTKLAGDVALRGRMGEEARKLAVQKYHAETVAIDTIQKAGLVRQKG
jgi:glycosyltransferase involved in cell wall biosynthesis